MILFDILSSEKRYKLNTATLAKEIVIDEKDIKMEILGIVQESKIEGLSFDYPSGWMYFEKNVGNNEKARSRRKYAKIIMLLSIPIMFLNLVFGGIELIVGFYIWYKGIIEIKTEDGKNIDIAGASMIGYVFNNLP